MGQISELKDITTSIRHKIKVKNRYVNQDQNIMPEAIQLDVAPFFMHFSYKIYSFSVTATYTSAKVETIVSPGSRPTCCDWIPTEKHLYDK